jgi:hypothetical protein
MRLLYCKECEDIFNLTQELKRCSCGNTSGKYVDNLNAVYSGNNAITLGFHKDLFDRAVRKQPQEGWGLNFEAFVIPKLCKTFKKMKEIT